jgi:NAD-dependent deacetylase
MTVADQDPLVRTLAAFFRPVFIGLGQIAYQDRLMAGLLALAAIAAVSPWSAAGALLGAITGTAWGRLDRRWLKAEVDIGLAAYNPAITGILWGGVLASGTLQATLIIPALLTCCALDLPLRRWLNRHGLPPLGVAAVISGWLGYWVFTVLGAPFWLDPGPSPLGPWGVHVSVALVAAMLLSQQPRAALLTASLSFGGSALVAYLLGWPQPGPALLWAFTLAPAAYGLAGTWLPGSAVGLRAGVVAAFIAGGLWLIWVYSPLRILPPLLAPAILGIWLSLWLFARDLRPALLDPSLARLAMRLRDLKRQGRPAWVLSGAGISTASGIPDYTSAAWLDPGIPTEQYDHDHFLAHHESRRIYWDACHRFRQLAMKAAPNPAHRAVARLQQAGWIKGVITQNVDRLHQRAGSTGVVELHGHIDQVGCLQCDWQGPWPQQDSWQESDPGCPECGGLIKPTVVAMGQDLHPRIWHKAEEAAHQAGMILIVGSRLAVSSAATLVAVARQHGASLAIINVGLHQQPLLEGDLHIELPAELALPALALLLDAGRDG